MNYEGMTIAELVAERDGINARIKEMREEAKANAEAEAVAREANARGNVKEGSIVSFMFNKEVVEGGKVLRVSEKSVTVESAVFAKGKGYRKYSEIVAIENAEVEETEEVA